MRADSATSVLQVTADPLPWERVTGTPAGTGICLSGGGLRAASFSFGVLQVLQERRGLLFGPTCANYLAAVSGGSYIAAAYMLAGAGRASDPDPDDATLPLSQGSPEEAHILANGEYLTKKWYRYLGLITLNILALVVLFVWLGTMLADLAWCWFWLEEWLVGLGLLENVFSFHHGVPVLLWLPVFIVGWFATVWSLYAAGLRNWMGIPSLFLIFVSIRPLLEYAELHPRWWSIQRFGIITGCLLGLLVLMLVLPSLAQRIGVRGAVAGGLNTLVVVSPRLLGLALLAWSTMWWYRTIDETLSAEDIGTQLIGLLLFFGSLFGGLLFSHVPHRASLHREYRDRLESCFAVRREGDRAVPVADPPLSTVAPPADGAGRFPRLLVCATANVHARVPGGGRSSFAPFVLSHDVCGVPGNARAAFETAKLELGREPAGVLTRRTEPLLSLFTAVACTGAAISPSMGRQTRPSVRPLIAALNVRLGRWFPNPFDPRAQRAVAERTKPGRFKFGAELMEPGYDELIPEMLGLDGPRVYVSDGGHYDNLGLLTLLRAKCAEIWCVDSSPDPNGCADELHRVLAVAKEELHINVDIDRDCFAAEADGLYGVTHTACSIRYKDGSTGSLMVVKLGLTSSSPADLQQRRLTDHGSRLTRRVPKLRSSFPHLKTFPEQVYGHERMDAYRRMGRDSASRALDQRAALSVTIDGQAAD